MEVSREYRGEDQQFLFLTQNRFLTQQVLEPTRGDNVLYNIIVLSSQNGLVDNVKILEPLGNSSYNQFNFDIKVKSESKNKYNRKVHNGKYIDRKLDLE